MNNNDCLLRSILTRQHYKLVLLAWLLLGVVLSRTASAAETARLALLDLLAVEQGFGKPQRDKSVDLHPISIAGRHFEHGLGTHSPGDVLIDLNGGSSRFMEWRAGTLAGRRYDSARSFVGWQSQRRERPNHAPEQRRADYHDVAVGHRALAPDAGHEPARQRRLDAFPAYQ